MLFDRQLPLRKKVRTFCGLIGGSELIVDRLDAYQRCSENRAIDLSDIHVCNLLNPRPRFAQRRGNHIQREVISQVGLMLALQLSCWAFNERVHKLHYERAFFVQLDRVLLAETTFRYSSSFLRRLLGRARALPRPLPCNTHHCLGKVGDADYFVGWFSLVSCRSSSGGHRRARVIGSSPRYPSGFSQLNAETQSG